jgi:hypothetical protein
VLSTAPVGVGVSVGTGVSVAAGVSLDVGATTGAFGCDASSAAPPPPDPHAPSVAAVIATVAIHRTRCGSTRARCSVTPELVLPAGGPQMVHQDPGG